MAFSLTNRSYAQMVEHLVAEAPKMACGYLISRNGLESVVRCKNIHDKLHALDPVTYPRTAEIAYAIDPTESDPIELEEQRGQIEIRGYYYSYTNDHLPIVSNETRKFRIHYGEPLVPRRAEIIISLGKNRGPKLGVHIWDWSARDYVEVPVILRNEPCLVQVVTASTQLLELLRLDFQHIYNMSPETFELFLCDRLSAMGLSVKRTGTANAPDGGIDIVACPSRPVPFPFLLAVQAKHHRDPRRRTDVSAVREFRGALDYQPFNAAALITNTTFTTEAQWLAEQLPVIVRLRDIADLRRWIWDNFVAEAEWREIPARLRLGTNLTIEVPRLWHPKKGSSPPLAFKR